MPGRENCYDSPRCFDRKIGHFYPSFLPLPHIQPKHTCMYIHTYYRVHTWSSPSHSSNSVAAVRRRQLLKRKGESKISECVCAQCYYLLDSYVYVCPHAIFYALLNFFLSNFYRDILLQTIHNIWQNRLLRFLLEEPTISYIVLKHFELSCDFDFVQN